MEASKNVMASWETMICKPASVGHELGMLGGRSKNNNKVLQTG